MDRAELLDGLRGDADAVFAVLRGLRPVDFARPTPCPAWDVRLLVAHLYRDFERVGEALSAPTDERPDIDSIGYWRYDRPANQVQTQDRAVQIASRFADGPVLVEGFADLVDAALDMAAAAAAGAGAPEPGPSTKLSWGPVITLDDLLATRWIELAVHSLDLTDALDRPPVVSIRGLALVADTLDGLAGAPLSGRPPFRGRDAADYVRAGTGRRPLTDDERAALTPAGADLFPLLA